MYVGLPKKAIHMLVCKKTISAPWKSDFYAFKACFVGRDLSRLQATCFSS